jgi:uncharacterized protein
MTKKQLIEKTKKFVRAKSDGETSGHDWWHTYRVWRTARLIGKKEGADLFVVELAALLHDIADFKFNNGDDSIGSKVSRRWLEKIGVDQKVISEVGEIVKNVSFKGAGVKNGIKSLEGRVVQDADRFDALGAIGIARVFAFGGYDGREIHDPKVKPKFHKTFTHYKNSRTTSINHFYEKILLLKDLMNTKTGKKMALARHHFLKKYLKQFFGEWEGKV